MKNVIKPMLAICLLALSGVSLHAAQQQPAPAAQTKGCGANGSNCTCITPRP